MSVALSDIGEPSGSFKIQAWVNGGSHDFSSNQFLGALTPPQINLGGDGLGNWNGLLEFDLNGFPGEQWFLFGDCDPCDMNCDGVVDALDIQSFLDLLFQGVNPCGTCTGDVNGDGFIDAEDIEGFIDCLFP